MRQLIVFRLGVLAVLLSLVYGFLVVKAQHRQGRLSILSRDDEDCIPFTVDHSNQCAYVMDHCSYEKAILSIPYLEGYFCSSSTARPFVLIGYIALLLFLFSFISISASDFFCPNLSTIASMLGLSENVAGVTFLAFGNGSPDLFSTFSAMRSNSGSLAVGELLGAGTFIVSVVAGSMSLIKPFRVEPMPFMRDVIFYALAVAALLGFLADGVFMAWEAGVLIGIYVLYVVAVIIGNWVERRREQARERQSLLQAEYGGLIEPYADDPESLVESPSPYSEQSPERPAELRSGLPVATRYNRALSAPPNPELLGSALHSAGPRSFSPPASPSPSESLLAVSGPRPEPHQRFSTLGHARHQRHLPSFSLLGAVEFRGVVNSLRRESAIYGPAVYDETLFAPHAGGHYSPFRRRRGSAGHIVLGPPSPTSIERPNPFDQPYTGYPLVKTSSPADSAIEGPSSAPSITVVPPDEVQLEEEPAVPEPAPLQRNRLASLKRALLATSNTLFPTLHSLPQKDWLGRIVSVISAPAVFVLTITLPVVVTQMQDEFDDAEMKEEDLNVTDNLPINGLLFTIQSVLGPAFCCFVIVGGTKLVAWLVPVCAAIGLFLAALVLRFGAEGKHRVARLFRCFLGFGVAMVWIMAIADEVVRLLQTLGVIFGLSDAVVGLTIFAVGNSLADLVANLTVASMGSPLMGLAACYAGPMLNILIGLGVAGSVIAGSEGYEIVFSSTLIVSAIGLLVILLGTMIAVPWNDYWLSRKWGASMIGAYVVIMLVNVLVELKF